ncbi:MAG TPA: hypothetical protein VLC09_05305 [Polyangiaceae bacterium]|nr:hypothetical protein [Polyangiaceae bacterium]
MAHPPLVEQFKEAQLRARVVADAVGVLDAEVKDKSGLGGLAIKAAFGVLQGVSPGIVTRLVDGLLDDFARSLDPFYQSAIAAGRAPGAELGGQPAAVANALLAVTDRRAARASGDVIKKTYEKLRPTAQKHVEASVPRLSGLLDRHAQR